MFLASNRCFRLKCESSAHNIAFPSGKKKVFSELGIKYAQNNHRLQVKTIQNSSKQICQRILMWEDNSKLTFSLEEVLLWIMDSYFGQKRWFKVKCLEKLNANDGFVSYRHAAFHFTRC